MGALAPIFYGGIIMQRIRFWPAFVLKFTPVFFVISVIIAINLYPGGNIHNYEQIGYVLSHNFLSDLGRFN